MQPSGNQDASRLILARDGDFSGSDSLHRKILQLGYANSRGAERLQQQPQPLIFLGRVEKPQVFCLAQFPVCSQIRFLLHAVQLNLAVRPAAENKEAVERGEHGVDR